MDILNKCMYWIFAAALTGALITFLFLCFCVAYRIITGEIFLFLYKWRLGLLGDFIFLMLLTAFISNRIESRQRK